MTARRFPAPWAAELQPAFPGLSGLATIAVIDNDQSPPMPRLDDPIIGGREVRKCVPLLER